MYIILFIIEEASSDPNIHMQETTIWYPRSRIFGYMKRHHKIYVSCCWGPLLKHSWWWKRAVIILSWRHWTQTFFWPFIALSFDKMPFFYFYLDNYHRVIKTCANKFSSDKWLLKYLYVWNYWNIVFKCADMLSIFIVTHSNNKWRKQNLENHHTDSLVNKFPARGMHVA